MIALSVGSAAQLALGIVFLASSAFKWLHPSAFARAVDGYGVIPSVAVAPVAGALALVESALAVSLLSGIGDELARPAAAVVLAGFLIVVAWTLRQGADRACGCFSSDERLSGRSLLRLALLLGLAAVAASVPAAGPFDPFSTDDDLATLRSVAVVGMAFAALVVGHLLLEASQLIAFPSSVTADRTRR